MSAVLLLALFACRSPPGQTDTTAGAPAQPLPAARLLPAADGARLALSASAPATGLPLADAALAGLVSVPRLSAAGRSVLELEQLLPLRQGGGVARFQARVQGYRVLDGEVRLLLDARGGLRAATWGAAVEQGLALGSKGAQHRLGPTAALQASLRALEVSASGAREIQLRGEWTELAASGLSRARARRVWEHRPQGLLPAWEVELWTAPADSVDGLARRLVVHAETGEVLDHQDLVVHAEVGYRVFVDEDLRPLDGPIEDLSPNPAAEPDGRVPAAVEPVRVSVEGLNTNPDGLADPWLPDPATESNGNNADAYADHYGPDGLSDGDRRAPTSAEAEFDWIYDTSLGPLDDTEQTDAAIVQAFYTVNWLHDWYYDVGFTEALGNAQRDNFGRGGEEADPLLIEAQDGAFSGSRNNANMSTPPDGSSPRMQIYLWSARSTQSLDVEPGGLSLDTNTAAFGPSAFSIEAPLALPGSDPEACLGVDADVSGAIVLIERGTCTFVQKVQAAQDAGASGVIIANNVPGAGANTLGGSSSEIEIGVYSVSYEDGLTLFELVETEEEVLATMIRDPGVEVDGSLDATVVAHEWGHYLLGRLVGCGTTQCGAINEGHADFVALSMMLREADDLEGAYAVGTHATAGYSTDPAWFGIRRVAYSVDPAINALSFRHISDGEPLPDSHPVVPSGNANSSVHNAGEIWASSMHEAQVAILSAREADGRTFIEAQQRVSEILVGGLALVASDPTYTELRDALIAVAAVDSEADALAIAEAFARRGMGSCAVSPDRNSTTLTGVVEHDALAPRVSILSLALDDSLGSCDDDGVLDGGELGLVRIELANSGSALLEGAELQLRIEESLPGLELDPEALHALPSVDPWSSAVFELPVRIERSSVEPGSAGLAATVLAPTACETEVEQRLWVRSESDRVPASSFEERFEVADGGWTVEGDDGGEIWSQVDAGEGTGSWVGLDVSGVTDSRLISPAIVAAKEADLVLTLEHRYDFEFDRTAAWDGGVIELSVDGGEWQDISAWVDPGYTHVLTTIADNPLGDRSAFSAKNPSWPGTDTLSLNLGEALEGRSLRFSLRIGTDQAASAPGWELFTVIVDGAAEAPFASWAADATDCNLPPVAQAGADLSLYEGETALVDGSASTDPFDEALSFTWSVPDGAPVALSDPSLVAPTLTALEVEVDTPVELTLTVSDGEGTASDTLTVQVLAQAEDSGTSDGGGESPDGGAEPGDGGGESPDGGAEADGGAEEVKDESCGGCQTAGGAGLLTLLLPTFLALRRRRRPGATS